MPRSPYPRPSPEDNPCLPKGERTHLRGEGVHDPPPSECARPGNPGEAHPPHKRESVNVTTFVLTLYCTQDTSQSEPSGSAGYMLSISEAVSPSMPGKRHWGRRSKLTKEEMEPREDRARGPRPGTGHPRGHRQALHILRGPGRRMGCLESRGRELGGCGSRRSELRGNKAKRALEGGCFPGEDGSGGLARHSAQPRGLASQGRAGRFQGKARDTYALRTCSTLFKFGAQNLKGHQKVRYQDLIHISRNSPFQSVHFSGV